MNLINQIMDSESSKKLNIDGTEKVCNCGNCKPIIEYPPLTEEEIEQIINERYFDKDDKTKNFIRKALRKHGDRYDYSNVVYIKAKSEVEIICRVEGHKPFPQTPDKHLSGHGCLTCGGSQRLTKEKFIERANNVHGIGTYDYSKVNYINNSTDVIISCLKHGDFKQTPAHHMNGEGCRICGIEKQADKQRLALEEFIEKANEIHGVGRYDYSKVIYVNMCTDVIISCLKHGDFKQTPQNHLNGKGCNLCAIEKSALSKKMTLEEFIEKANKVHGEGTYDYSKVVYLNNSIDITIICPIHGDFPQNPNNHLKGAGCPLCSGNKKLTTEEFIEKANKVHGEGIYDYSKVEYINNHTDVIIICPKHGPFPQKPTEHFSGCGCPKCNKNKGEESVRKFLTKKGIEFEEQKKFEGCKYKQPLKFDFYLPKYNLCIESDGNIHFKKINWNGKMTEKQMEENLKSTQLRDQIKNDYCKNNGITLLRVNNLRAYEEVEKYFQNNNLLK